MTEQTPKEYLQKIKKLDVCIDSMCEEVNRLRAMAESQAIKLDDKVQTSGSKDLISSNVAKIVDLERSINSNIDRFVDYKKEVLEKLQALDNADYYSILYLRYFKYLEFNEISVEMHYSYRHTLRIHGWALEEFKKLI